MQRQNTGQTTEYQAAKGQRSGAAPNGPSNRALLIILLAILAALAVTLALVFGRTAASEEPQPEEPQRDRTYILYNGKEYKYDEHKTNLLFLGVDKDLPMAQERKPGDMGLADAILMVSLDTVDKTMHIIAIPRETMTNVTLVDSEGKTADKEKTVLTFQYAYGKTPEQSGELMMQAVSELMYGTPIEKYCAVNFEAVPILNEEVGGVEVEILEDMTFLHPEFVKGAVVHLDGEMAFDYIHYRDTDKTGTSITRMDRQKQYILAYLQKMKSFADQSIESLYDLYERLGENMSTNITTEDMISLTNTFSGITMEEIELMRIPGEIQTGDAYDVYYDVYIADQEELKKLVIDVFYEAVEGGKEQ